MPRFCANTSFLFTESPFEQRFGAAARAGFTGVEFHFPYAFDKNELAGRAAEAGVEVVLFDLPPGDWDKGERGLACLPARMSEFRDGVGLAIDYARVLGCRRLNMLSGIVPVRKPPIAAEKLRETFLSNLRFAADSLAAEDMTLTIEPISTRAIPGIYLRYTAQAAALLEEAGAAAARLQYDLFHMQVMEGDLAATLQEHIGRIAHIQMADVPGRQQPGTGEINFPWLFAHIDRLGYEGWIGAEYRPSERTEDSLDWFAPYRSGAGAR